ncbi:MAG: phosphoribosylformylglycinamidine synthase subunit PurS [Bdellovibrionota bacterium]
MRIGVKVMPRKEVLDTQGRAVESTLKNHGKKVTHCQVGRYVILDIPETDGDRAMAHAKDMAELVLHNPLIETFELERL